MRKIIFVVLLIAFVFSLGAQSLQDNEYYLRMVELREQSEQAFAAGDYIEAKRLAEEAQSYKAQSDEWISNQLAIYRANSALKAVREKLSMVSGLKSSFASDFAQADNLYNKAYNEYHTQKNYVMSLQSSRQALTILDKMLASNRLPAFYKVRLIRGNRDSLWKIAGYKFVYGDPWKWPLLYHANKGKLPREQQPDLILPDMILAIPPLEGEQRSGTWINGEIKY